MVRTQIQLEEAQHERLKALAGRSSKSISQLVREAVEKLLSEAQSQARWATAWDVVGSGRDAEGRTDVAERHDEYLARLHGDE